MNFADINFNYLIEKTTEERLKEVESVCSTNTDFKSTEKLLKIIAEELVLLNAERRKTL
jgi:hypothetical protein